MQVKRRTSPLSKKHHLFYRK